MTEISLYTLPIPKANCPRNTASRDIQVTNYSCSGDHGLTKDTIFTGWIIQLIITGEDQLVSGSEDATIRVWDLLTGSAIHVVTQDAGISCLMASKLKGREDDLVLFGDRDGKMSYIDLETLHVIQNRQW